VRFNKYMKLRNHYDSRSLTWWLTWNLGLRDAKYVATEKLHGANFSTWVMPNGTVKYGKRSGFLSEDESFFRWKEAVEHEDFVAFIDAMKHRTARLRRSLVFYGELFGGGIQKQVDYQPQQCVRFFDVYDPEKNEYWAPKDVYELIPEALRVPHVGFYNGINEAMNAQHEFPTLLNPREGNTCEGVVIRPWNKTYQTEADKRFAIKKKNDKFKEKAKVPRARKEPKEMPPEVIAALDIIIPYVTPQRLSNVISHEGEPQDMTEFGKFLRLYIQDVRDECLQENPHFHDSLGKKEAETVWKMVGAHCSAILKDKIING